MCDAGYQCVPNFIWPFVEAGNQGTCAKCVNGQYCPENTTNPMALPNWNVCHEGFFCSDPSQREVCPLRALSAARRGCQAAGGPTQTAEPGRGASRGHGWPVVSTLPLNEVFKSSCCNSCKSAQKFAHTRSLCASLRTRGALCGQRAKVCVRHTRAACRTLLHAQRACAARFAHCFPLRRAPSSTGAARV